MKPKCNKEQKLKGLFISINNHGEMTELQIDECIGLVFDIFEVKDES